MRDVRMRGFRHRTSVADALAVLAARTGPLGPELVLLPSAAGRVVTADVAAVANVPQFERAAMDGYAVVGESTFGATSYAPVRLAIAGESRPARPHPGVIRSGQAVRITTGAPLPAGADAVLMAENAKELEDGQVLVSEPIAPGKHVGHIGEDVRQGDVVVRRGRRLRPQDVGLLASVGAASVEVVRRPSVRILITGDELLAPGQVPHGWSIVDANSLVLAALARRDGAEGVTVTYVEDRRERVAEALATATEDVVLISGGSSVGPEDHAPVVLAELGELTVHGLAMRPSSPAGFGFLRAGDGAIATPVFLLPGNPVSCLCAYEFFAGPTLRAMGGRPRAWPHQRVRLPVTGKIVSELGRTDYVRVTIEQGQVRALMTSGASILSSTTRADGVVLVAAGDEGHGEGALVEVLLYDDARGDAVVKQDQFLHVQDRDEAERSFRAAIGDLGPLGREEVNLGAALGRVLADDVRSPVDVPGFDRANVDGFAVRAADTFGASEQTPMRLALAPGAVVMGEIPRGEVGAGSAMTIPTGGVVPRGADAVVMVEHTRVERGEVVVVKSVTPGRSITFAGTDIAQGETVLRARDLLTSRETGVLAAMGVPRVAVVRRPTVAILSTGDELVAPGTPLTPGQIYDSNAVILADATRECGGAPIAFPIVADHAPSLRDALTRALAVADVVLLSGGTSKGPGDLNVRALEDVLAPPGVVAHGVALKPGKPLCLAVSGRIPVVVLPGFPTSAIFTFHEFVAPVIRAMAGLREAPAEGTRCRLPFRTTSEIGRTEYVLVRLVEGDDGATVAYPIGKGSGSVTTFSQADGYFTIPREVELLDEGEPVLVRPLGGFTATSADLVVIGSHCVGLDVIVGRLAARGIRSKLIAVGSEGGLAAAKRGECDVAGVHLFDAASGSYNGPFVGPGLDLHPGYGRLQGLVFRRGDARFEGRPADVAVREAVREPGVVMVNRNRGSGTRALYDRLLGDARPAGYGVEASSHHAIAAAVAQSRADFGIAIDLVARDRGLGFSPIGEERFDFIVPSARATRPAVRAFLAEIADPDCRQALSARGLRP